MPEVSETPDSQLNESWAQGAEEASMAPYPSPLDEVHLHALEQIYKVILKDRNLPSLPGSSCLLTPHLSSPV